MLLRRIWSVPGLPSCRASPANVGGCVSIVARSVGLVLHPGVRSVCVWPNIALNRTASPPVSLGIRRIFLMFNSAPHLNSCALPPGFTCAPRLCACAASGQCLVCRLAGLRLQPLGVVFQSLRAQLALCFIRACAQLAFGLTLHSTGRLRRRLV
jgi:hypothetical protein